MPALLHALSTLLTPRVIQTGPIVLSEQDAGSTCPETKLEKGKKAVVIRFENWPYSQGVVIPVDAWLFPLFSNNGGTFRRSCDYILFYKESETLFVLLIELKSGSARGSAQQMRNGKLIADYILSVAHLHCSVDDWPSEIFYRGVVFAGTAPVMKGPSKGRKGVDYKEDLVQPELRTAILRAGFSYKMSYLCA